MKVEILTLDKEIIVNSLNARIAKVFDNKILVTCDRTKISDLDEDALNSLVGQDEPFQAEFWLSVHVSSDEDAQGTFYRVNNVERLTEVDLCGGRLSDVEILLFDVSETEKWSS